MSFNLGSAVAYLDVDSSKFTSGFAKAKNELKIFNDDTASTSQKLGGLSSAMSSVGSSMTKNVTLPLVGVGTAVTAIGAQFESGMSKVKAISGATGEEMDQLRDKAMEMGAKTKFSASESADAFTYMAMAGWDAGQMIDGIGGIMSLAAADGLDLATTSDIVTDALTAFGLKAEDSAHFADVLAKASSSANTNVSMLGESFKYVAPVAGSLGYSVEDTAVALGLMANAGIKGSQSGTVLRAALTNMIKPTDDMVGVMNRLGIAVTNEDGSMKTLQETMDNLRSSFAITTEEQKKANYAAEEQIAIAHGQGDKLKQMTQVEKERYLEMSKGIGIIESWNKEQLKSQAKDVLGIKLTKERTLTEEEYVQLANTVGQEALQGLTQARQAEAAATLFGKEAMSGMLAIINASEEDYNKLSDAIGNADGTADKMAETMQDNLQGAMTLAGSALEGLAIRISELLIPTVTNVVQWFTKVVEKMSSMSDGALAVTVALGVIVAAIGPLLLIGAKLINGVMTLHTAFVSIQPAIAAVGSFIAGLSTPVLVVAGVVAAFAVAWATNFMGVRDKTKEITDAIGNLLSAFGTLASNIIQVFLEFVRELWESDFMAIQEITAAIFDSIRVVIDTVMTVIRELINVATALIQGDWRSAWESVKTIFNTVWEGVKSLLSNYLSILVDLIVGAALTFHHSAKETFNKIMDGFKEIWDAIVEWFKKAINDPVGIIEGIGQSLYDAGAYIFNMLWDGLKSIWDGIVGWVNDAVDWIEEKVQFWKDKQAEMSDDDDDYDDDNYTYDEPDSEDIELTALRSGLKYVPYDGFKAKLHTGERVLTAQENKERSGSKGDTFNFYGTKPLDERETVRQFKKAQRDLALGV